MAKLVSKKTTTTVTEEIAIVPAAPGEEKGHRFMKVHGYGTYRGSDGGELSKPQINLNGKNGNISSSIFVCTLKNSYRQKYQPGVYKPGWCNLLLLVFLFLELLHISSTARSKGDFVLLGVHLIGSFGDEVKTDQGYNSRDANKN